MGLDVYLRKCDDLAAERALEAQYEEQSEANWNAVTNGRSYDALTEEEKESVRVLNKALAESLGLEEYGSSPRIETVEINSALYPEHMFKIGYLRSSYNEGGINSVLGRIGLPDLNDMFDADGTYDVKPNWAEVLVRVEDVIARYRTHVEGIAGQFDITTIRSPFNDGMEASEAMEVFIKQLGEYEQRKKDHGDDTYSSYGSRDGEFYMKGIKVFAMIPNSGWGKGYHVVFEKENAGQGAEADWYYQALLVTKEMVAYVLSRPQDEQHKYSLAWSG